VFVSVSQMAILNEYLPISATVILEHENFREIRLKSYQNNCPKISQIFHCMVDRLSRPWLFSDSESYWIKNWIFFRFIKTWLMNIKTKMSVHFMYNILTIWQHFWWGIIYIRLQFNFFNWRKEFHITTFEHGMTGRFHALFSRRGWLNFLHLVWN